MSQRMDILLAGPKRIHALYDGFEIRTDQSIKNGGEASAPEPFDLFLASLGTCAAFYVHTFCEKRGLASAGIRIVQSWSRDDSKRLAEISLDINVPADFPDKYHAALVRAADQCSVKRVLADPPDIRTRVVAEK